MEIAGGIEIAEKFAAFVAHTEFGDVDRSVIEQIKKLTLKQVLGTLVGSTSPTIRKFMPYIKDNLGRPESGVYGCGFKTDVAQAALANGFLAHASEMEDDQFPGGGISDVTIWPALLPVAEKLKLSGQEMIVALYVGLEMQNRIAMWASVATDALGILNLPFLGIYGATASCAKAYGCTEEQIKSSFGLAMVTGVGYIYEMGTDAHFWESAAVCRNGVLNAIMARNGFTSKPVIRQYLERIDGKEHLNDFDKKTEGLGKAPYYANNTWIKKWGFCFATHTYVDILTDLMKKNHLRYEDIEEVALHFDQNRYLVVNRPEPKNAEDSRFSTQHILAYLMLYGECNLETCTEKMVKDPRIAEARKKMKVIYHPEKPFRIIPGEGAIDLKLKNGKVISGSMEQPYGAPMYPLTVDQVVDIYRRFSQGILSDAHVDRTIDIILNMEKKPDLQELFDICTFRHLIK